MNTGSPEQEEPYVQMRRGRRIRDPSGEGDEGDAGLFSPTRGAEEAWKTTPNWGCSKRHGPRAVVRTVAQMARMDDAVEKEGASSPSPRPQTGEAHQQ